MIDFLHHERSHTHGFLVRASMLAFVLGFNPVLSDATPLGHHLRRDNGADNVKAKIWVPILVIVLVLVLIGILIWSKRSLGNGLASMGEAAAVATGTTTHRDLAATSTASPSTRELTAEQLAGRTGSSTPATQARRTGRRNRRTPSQISTKSLPVYQKEPGDQELVIYRGQEEEDAADITTADIMPPVEEAAEGQTHSRQPSRNSQYGNLPESPQNMSLIQGDESFDPAGDASTRHLLPPTSQGAIRSSFETIEGSEESTTSLMQAVQATGTDPRGDAPPYFEAVDSGNSGEPRQAIGSPNTAQTPGAPSESPSSPTVGSRRSGDTQTSENRNSRRLSGFRSLLHTLTNTNHRPPIPPIPQEPAQSPSGHNRAGSAFSVTSLASQESRPQTRERVASRASHRPSNSASGSMMQTALRTISRQKSHTTLNSAHLNSPSMISLNSISAPLSHTLTRTEISYPASGPTADQMRLISSRESFARFGVPYGPDAIAYAASASRHDLEPTPDYESHAPPPAAAARASPLAEIVTETPAEESQSSPDTSSSQSLEEAPAEPASAHKPESNLEPTSEKSIVSPVKDSPVTQPGATSSASPPVAIPPASLVPSNLPIKAPTPVSVPPPPSAFKTPPSSATPLRPESRADSMMSALTYATAEESQYDSAPSGTHTPELPSTPQGASFHAHAHENTDTTISQGMIPVTTQSAA